MVKLAEMSMHEKYRRAFDAVRAYQAHILPFIEKRSGYPASLELDSVWQAGIQPVNDKSLDAEKYETAYSNWLWVARCTLDFVTEQMGPEDMEQLVQLLVLLHQRENARVDLALLQLLGDFQGLAEAFLYDLQWMTPLEMGKSQPGKIVGNVPQCKILEVPATRLVCAIGCQRMLSIWATQQLKLNLAVEQQNGGCRLILTPKNKSGSPQRHH